MTTTSVVFYSGNLKTESQHLQSGEKIITDAPIDNKGMGEAFSPTDLAATSLANCMMTVMGITANRHNIDINGARADVEKFMGVNPRRIVKIKIDFHFPMSYDTETMKLLEKSALNCPLAKSLSASISQNIHFNYG